MCYAVGAMRLVFPMDDRNGIAFNESPLPTAPASSAWPARSRARDADLQGAPEPRAVDAAWDAVFTVCDAARDACPYLPGARATAHWGLMDPAAAQGEHAVQLAAFRAAREHLHAAVMAFIAMPPASPALTDASNIDALHAALAAERRALDAAVAQADGSAAPSYPSTLQLTDALRPHL
jgi:hypothetical protein